MTGSGRACKRPFILPASHDGARERARSGTGGVTRTPGRAGPESTQRSGKERRHTDHHHAVPGGDGLETVRSTI